MKPTQFSDLNDLLNDFVVSHQELLDDNLIGIYLQGSAAVGDMDVFSDVDFIVVTGKDLNEYELADLQKMHSDFYDRKSQNHWAEHFEGSYFSKDVLRRTDQLDVKLAYIDNGSSLLEWDIHCNTLVVRWCLREFGIALVGPSPDSLVDPVPADLLKAEIQQVMAEWGEEIFARGTNSSRFYQPFITISYCRMLHTLTTGRIHSKPAGVAWALENLDPEWADLFYQVTAERGDSSERARQSADPTDMQRTLEFVAYANEKANLRNQV
jgi:predicted nucleotidyltransferase